jgi:predicted enzyme related to lactoylglutathione lyase
MDVMDVGRMAAFIDPTGAFCSIWQPGTHPGAALVNEPNTLCWNELNTRDVDTAKEFYSTVFGVTTHTSDMEGMTYTEVKVADASIAGIMAMPEQVPAQVPAHWLSYFAVEDTDATVAKAESLGASVMMPPTDIPPGRFAVLTDPHGAAFAVIKMNPMP